MVPGIFPSQLVILSTGQTYFETVHMQQEVLRSAGYKHYVSCQIIRQSTNNSLVVYTAFVLCAVLTTGVEPNLHQSPETCCLVVSQLLYAFLNIC